MSKRFLKSSRPSLLIKRAALGNLKASFHCTHWHRFFPLKKEFSKTYPSFLTVKEGVFSTSPSLLQGEFHLSHQASLPSGTRGCSWLRYSLRQSSGIVSEACARKGLPMIVYAIELRVFVGWRIIIIYHILTIVFYTLQRLFCYNLRFYSYCFFLSGIAGCSTGAL